MWEKTGVKNGFRSAPDPRAHPRIDALPTGRPLGPTMTSFGTLLKSYPGTLTEAERDKLLALWLLRDVKAARPILRQAGIELDDF